MAPRKTRQQSAASDTIPIIPTIPTAADEDSENDVQRLEVDRARNDQKLKSRFEHIFRKYEHDFTGVGDEIDLETGEIVVNNGHLQHMRNEIDPGKSASSRFVRTFQEKLEHEDETTSSEDDSESGDSDDEEGEEEEEEEEGDTEPGRAPPRIPVARTSQTVPARETALQAFSRMSRPAPRLARLLVGEGTPQRPIDLDGEESAQDISREASVASSATPIGASSQTPALKRPMSSVKSATAKRPSVDNDAIQALGMTIANQLAQLMAGPSKKKKSKKSKAALRRSSRDSTWDYPDLRRSRQEKRKRSPSPVQDPQPSSPNFRSPSRSSIWAEEDSTRLRKRKRQDVFAEVVEPPVRRFGGQTDTPDSKRCWNCSLTRSAQWQKGPHGQDLCSSCGHYYERHGRMKPFDSPTPSVEEDPSHEQSDQPIDDNPGGTEQPLDDISADGPPTDAGLDDSELRLEGNLERDPAMPLTPALPESLEVKEEDSVAEEANVARSKTPGTSVRLPRTPNPTYSANTSRPISATPTPNKPTKWTPEDDALIIKYKEHDKMTWDTIGRQIPSRGIFSLQHRYSSALHDRPSAGRDLFNLMVRSAVNPQNATKPALWTNDQDELLLELREDRELDWTEIASTLPGRTAEDVRIRYHLLSNPAGEQRSQSVVQPSQPNIIDAYPVDPSSRRHLHFTPDEDALLVRLREVDHLSWQEISTKYTSRPFSSLQKRYSAYLTPTKRSITPAPPSHPIDGTMDDRIIAVDAELARLSGSEINSERFKPEEDELIKTMFEDEGLSWDDIAAKFPGRSPNLIRNRYRYKFLGPGDPVASLMTQITSAATNGDMATAGTGPPTKAQGKKATSGPGSRNAFTPSEDEVILHLKEAQGQTWDQIAQELPGRSAKAIATRYETVIRPQATATIPVLSTPTVPLPSPHSFTQETADQGHGHSWRRYTPKEDALLVRLREQGVSWAQMAHHFPGRASASLQSHWQSKYGNSPSRSRKSLPSTLPSGSANPLLRRALGNSLRRRSDINARALPQVSAQPVSEQAADSATQDTFMLDPALRESGESADHSLVPSEDASLEDPSQQLNEELSQAWTTRLERSNVLEGSTPRLSCNTEHETEAPSPLYATPTRHQSVRQPHFGPTRGQYSDAASETMHVSQEHVLDGSTPAAQSKRTRRALSTAETAPSEALSAAGGAPSNPLDHATTSPVKTRSRTRQSTKPSARTQMEDITPATEETTATAQVLSPVTSRCGHNPIIEHVEQTLGVPPGQGLTWRQLIYMAFQATHSKIMAVKDIYTWMEANYGSHCLTDGNWKSRVRAELSKGIIAEHLGYRSGGRWRIKNNAAEKVKRHSQSRAKNGIEKQTAIEIPSVKETIVLDSDDEEPAISTVVHKPDRPPARHVTFSPMVTITTLIQNIGRRGRSRPLRSREQGTSAQKQPAVMQIDNSGSEHDVPSSDADMQKDESAQARRITRSRTANSTSIPDAQPPRDAVMNAVPSSDVNREPESSPKPSNSPGRDKSVKTSSDSVAPAQSSSSPAFMKPKAPASIYKKPKLPGTPRIAQIKSNSTPRRASTPVINQRFSTPAGNATKRMVETPERELRDPEEDELAWF